MYLNVSQAGQYQSSSADVSPCPTPVGTPMSTHAPKYGTVIPNRIFVGGITTTTTEAELKAFFASYGAVKDTKIIADRGGVSKGYGFVTFESQEDADRILKKESENLIFKDRKLNIGPAIRKQVHMTTQLLADLYAQGAAENRLDAQYAANVLQEYPAMPGDQIASRTPWAGPRTIPHTQVSPRSYGDPNLHPGTILLSTNGVPYTYQNGMAIFHAPESGYPIHQQQMTSPTLLSSSAASDWPTYSANAVMIQQPPPPVYAMPTYPTYQPGTPPQWTATTPTYQPGTPPQWSATTPSQWRWAAQNPAGQSVQAANAAASAAAAGYVFAAIPPSQDLMYAQPPPQAQYQHTDLTEATTVLEAPPIEGTVAAVAKETLPCSSGGGGSIHHMYVTDLPSTSEQQPQRPLPSLPPVTASATPMYTVHTSPQMNTQLQPPPSSLPLSIKTTAYRKAMASAPPRRSYSSSTLLVKHGHKVQRLMAKSSAGPIRTILQTDTDATMEGALTHSQLTAPMMNKAKASQIVSAYEAF